MVCYLLEEMPRESADPSFLSPGRTFSSPPSLEVISKY